MLIFGAGEFAEVMIMKLSDSRRVSALPIVNREYYKEVKLPGRYTPTLIYEDYIQTATWRNRIIPDIEVIIAMGPANGNRDRQRVFEMLMKGPLVVNTYCDPQAIVAGGVNTGSVIFEQNNLQYCAVGENVVMWSGNHVGHGSRIGSHSFITSHVCIGGGATIGERCFIGMNATVFDHVTIGNDCVIAAGAVVDRDIPAGHTLSRKGVLVANAA